MKTLAIALAVVLALGGAAGGTYALLYASREVNNTFTAGDISLTLTETPVGEGESNTYVMEAGAVIDKDPTITVLAGSEPCWLFAQLTESANLGDFITYTVEPALWTPLEGHSGVYYTQITQKSAADRAVTVLQGNQVVVRSDVTNAMLRELTPATYPTLSVKAWAVQLSGIATAQEAWQLAGGQQTP